MSSTKGSRIIRSSVIGIIVTILATTGLALMGHPIIAAILAGLSLAYHVLVIVGAVALRNDRR